MNIEPEKIHHDFSPSSLESMEVCPCFKNRQTEKLHERTIAGTKGHKVAESRQDDNTLSDDDAEAVAECLDLVEKRKATFSGSVTEIKEEYLPVDDLQFPDGVKHTTAGYADTVLVDEARTRAEIIDYKLGMWPVTNAKENPQGIAYALGVFHRFPTVQTVRVWFVQPHVSHTTDATFTRAQVPELYLRVQTIVARAREARAKGDFSTATPTTPICQFCGNLGTCPAVAAIACRIGKKFHPLAFNDENLTPTMIHDAANTNLGMRLAATLKVWSEAFRRQVTDRVLALRAPIPDGFKLETRSEREIIDMPKLKEIALKYLTPAEFESTLSTTFGSMEEIISNNAPRGSKKETLQEFKKALEDAQAVKRSAPYSFLKAIPKDKE